MSTKWQTTSICVTVLATTDKTVLMTSSTVPHLRLYVSPMAIMANQVPLPA